MLSSKRRSVPVVIRGIDHVIVGSILLMGMDPPGLSRLWFRSWAVSARIDDRVAPAGGV
jgi:hypothetical protein